MRRTIGVRDAKANLSRLLAEVKHGVEWIITDRGVPVAKLGPIPEEERTLEQRLAWLEERGLLEKPPTDQRRFPPPLPIPENLAQRWLQEGRDR